MSSGDRAATPNKILHLGRAEKRSAFRRMIPAGHAAILSTSRSISPGCTGRIPFLAMLCSLFRFRIESPRINTFPFKGRELDASNFTLQQIRHRRITQLNFQLPLHPGIRQPSRFVHE